MQLVEFYEALARISQDACLQPYASEVIFSKRMNLATKKFNPSLYMWN